MANGNGTKTIPWQTWFSSAASIIFTISSVVFWETRNIVYDTKANQIKVIERLENLEMKFKDYVRVVEEFRIKIHDLERSHERYIDNIQSIPIFRTTLEGYNVRINNLEGIQKNIDSRVTTILQRLSSIHQIIGNRQHSIVDGDEER